MSSKRPTPIMNSSRPRTSVEVIRKTRHDPRTRMEPAITSFSSHVSSDMTHPSFAFAQGLPDVYSGDAQCWTMGPDNFYAGDMNHIPTLSVAPTYLTHQPHWDNMERYDIESSSAFSGPSSHADYSPPLSEILPSHVDMFQCQSPLDQFGYSMAVPLTPPGMLDMFDNACLPEPAMETECEYIGPAKFPHSSAPIRHSQPRPIRSASERSPISPSSGSPYPRLAKDDHVERVKHNPRNDPRYEEKADKDGYFHCPYASTAEGCSHRPTKQKCIYAKNLDSHLKPYTCRYGDTDENCRNLRFSSNACLFRHEREMHGMHNHGMNPYLCKFQGCERARRDNGFPRRWNQRDHMKRVHGYEELDSDESVDRGYTDSSARRKKSSSSSHHVPMKRTGSSRAQNNYSQGVHRNVNGPRHVVQPTRGLQARNVIIPGIQTDEMSFTSQQMMNQSYGNYMQSVY